jgi:hypothetical protein
MNNSAFRKYFRGDEHMMNLSLPTFVTLPGIINVNLLNCM